jgi:hypothetical protein
MNENHRAAYVAGLEQELRVLERRPNPNMRRVQEVCAELEKYRDTPANPQLETATPAKTAQRGRPRTRKPSGE